MNWRMLVSMDHHTKQSLAAPPSRLVKVTSPFARRLAGHAWFPLWAVMHHVGRKSGAEYAIPVAIIPTRGSTTFLVGLPWGETTNWAQNVLAAGGATVTWKGRDWAATNPRLVGPDVAVGLAKAGPIKKVIGSGRFPAFIQLDC
jgi:deazaflavin-dependent oxidoreductase (nitroreductase family)